MIDRSEFEQRAHDVMLALQASICDGLTALEHEGKGTATFKTDRWDRTDGGGGVSRVMEGGAVFEKAGVNVSAVHGTLEPAFAAQLPGEGDTFFATGVSLVIHPRNPLVPTVHANFRHIAHGSKRWFGGGADLTPYYYYEEDSAHFHKVWRAYCENNADVADYTRFRDWCDHYFYLVHRNERRGVGGIFFDSLYVKEDEPNHADRLLAFVQEGGQKFLDAYGPIVRRRMALPYTDEQRAWQSHRRGRYVEFNLIYDRGTVFGLKTGGRTESILMSMPPIARWTYGYEPAADSPEEALLKQVQRPRPPLPEGASEK